MPVNETWRRALTDSKCVQIEADCFDLEQIMESGQCFRIYRIKKEASGSVLYRATAADQTVLIQEEKCENANVTLHGASDQKELLNTIHSHRITFFCSESEYQTFWCHYFDLNADYRKYEQAIDPSDEYLKSAFLYGSGIRILNQDPWEMLITFIISQRKNIPAIRQAVESLSRECGNCIDKENEIYAFPTPEELASLSLSRLQELSLGYRAKYIYDTAKKVASGEINLKNWEDLNDSDLHKALLSCYGVGEKVANCVALFGYHRIGAFPVDVWIDRIQKEHYNGHFPVEKYEGFAGVLQQYLFYYERKRQK